MNPLAIRVAADLKAFKANMAEMKTQLETNASAMKRMASAFDGSKVIGDANAMVKAIHDIGGASKLTDSEMRRVNGTVNEALAKYKALGRDAPPELVKLRDATAKMNVETAKAPSLMEQMTGKVSALGVAAGTFLGNVAWSAVNKLGAELGEFAKRGIQLNAVQSSFERLATATNESSAQMLSSMQTASRGMVADFDLMKAANKAMLLGLPVTAESMGTLSKAAVTLGRAMGQDATKSVDDLITALGRSSPMILDNLGITVKVGEANEIYAAKLKKTVEQLTDAEKKTAFYEEAMRRANEKTKELGESTKTLGEMLQTAWVSIGNVVTSGVSDYNIAIGAAFSSTQNFARFLSVAMTQGFTAAVQLFAAMEKGKGTVEQLTDSQKKYVDELLKSKNVGLEAVKAMNDPAINAYLVSLGLLKEDTGKLTEEQKKAAAEAKRLAEAFQKQVDVLTGKALIREVAALAKQVEAAGKQGGITASEYEKLGKQLDDMMSRGARLPNILHNIWLSHERLNPSIKVTTDAYKILADMMKGIKPVTLGMPTPVSLPVSLGPIDLTKLGKQLGALQPPPEIKTFGDKLAASIAKSLEGLGSVIVGAIQGGGDVARAAFSHIGLILGTDLGNAISKALGGTLGKIVGGFAGPLGALLGDALGSLVGKLKSAFGWDNPGRDAIKAFFKEFKGGADGLREALLVLGDEGERLWIRLTQDARGPAQVKAAIKEVEDAFKRAEAKAKALRDEIARINSEGGLISSDLKEWLGANPNDPEAQAFILGQVKTAGTAIGKMLEAMERAAKAVGKELKLTAGGAKAMSLIMLAAWDGSAQGLRDMAPDIERLRAALERSGIDGGKAFAQLSAMAKLATDEITGPMLEAINHGTSALTAMYNSGFLTQEVFQGLVDEIMLQRDALLKSGATADTVNAAMRNDLQRIWELVKDGKFAVDEKTAALLREAEAQGTVGDKYRSSTDRMVIALERLVKIFTQGGDAMEEVADSLGNKMVKVFTVTMVNAARDGVKQVQDLLNGIKMNEVVVNIRAVNSISAAPTGPSGSAPSWFGGSTTSAAPSVRNSSASFTIVNVTTLDGEVVARKTVKHTAKLLPGELQFTGGMR